MSHHVIIGGGPAGINAIETIRQFDSGALITLITNERPYARMALPYFLAKEITEAQLDTGSDQYFERLRVERRIGRRAVQIDSAARTVYLDDGSVVGYDTLLIASGSSPLRPAIAGSDGRYVHNLWSVADAIAVQESSRAKCPSAVLVGGGFIGLIILNALHKRGWKLALIEQEVQILPKMLDRRGAEAAEAWLRERGVEIYTGCGVLSIAGARKKAVALTDGQTLGANLVILSTGIRPNLGFLNGSGVEIDHGILVDAEMRTNVPGIFAAGDVAQGPNLLGGPPVVHAIQPTAVDHGRVAGANMAGRSVSYPGSLAMNILDVAGLHCTSFGRWQDNGDTNVMWNAARPIYRKLVWAGTRLAGGIIVGPAEDATMLTDVGMLKGLIQSQVDLGAWKEYLRERPWDLRRAFVASRAASQLLTRSTIGRASPARGFRFDNLGPRGDAGPYHADFVATCPADFDRLPRTPTPGINKSPLPKAEKQ
ncbi:MAG: NAD(P)/FAD-dependent oxidoreductase [Deltaproteobacteria bacterium]|nr:NAD(P)/FAD-dependent oxidoreductase [Deltaproteobacteria bacterium]